MFGGAGGPPKPTFTGFGTATSSAGQTGFSFTSPTGTTLGAPTTQQAPASGFMLGSTPAQFGAPSSNLFGTGNTVAGATTTSVAPFGSGAPSIFSSTAQTGFGFGSNVTSTSGFPAFGTAAPASSAAPSLGLGTTAFSAAGAATGTTGGFTSTFGQNPTPTTSTTLNFGPPSAFGSTPTAPQTTTTTLGSAGFTPGLQLGAQSTSTPLNLMGSTTAAPTTSVAPVTPFAGFGQSLTSTPISTSSNLTQALGTPATTPGFPTPSLTTAATPATSLATLGSSTTTFGGITFGTPSATSKPVEFGTPTTTGLSFTSTLTATTSAPATSVATGLSTGFTFGGTPAKTTAPGFSLGTAATSAATTTTAPLSIVATTASLAPATTQAPPTTVSSSTPAQSAPAGPSINFRKLEEDINKWTSELEEQERIFLTQATQVNAWDRVLIANGDKITQLNDALERVKLDQEHLDTEVDFIEAQQRELEELLVPLEKSVESFPNLSIHQHADLEREQTFQMAENIDAQLRQMSKDLKEIIEHINTSAGTQDSNDPICQISKILNAHMDSLQWIDQSTAQLQKKVEEVGHLYEMRRQDHQRGVQLPF